MPDLPVPGLYFHIPFCRKACVYCDFHFSTSPRTKPQVLAAMRKELRERHGELGAEALQTIYFGGGTPSQLTPQELGLLLQEARSLTAVLPEAEITIEANPDDMNAEVLAAWQELGINRVSLGVQSFREERLQWMGRAHNARQTLDALKLLAGSNLRSWTIDLLYALPGMVLAEWDEQLAIALDHGMPHLSAYCLTVEPHTALIHHVETGKVTLPPDDRQMLQFDHAINKLDRAGLQHYEISNFGREGHFAVHNTNYWKGVPYLGIGPSAHSFSGLRRRWNVANNVRYAQGVDQGTVYWEEETLTARQRSNEVLLTGLRTMWGVELAALGQEFGQISGKAVQHYIALGELRVHDGRLFLTAKGKHFADRIASDLFMPTT